MRRSSTPRVVVAFRDTEWDQLLERHATPGQVRFFLETRERDVEEILGRHRVQTDALKTVEQAIPTHWRRVRIHRDELSGFPFEPGDIVLAVGQDGLVPNLAKYLTDQLVIGLNPDPNRYEGTLVRWAVERLSELLAAAEAGELGTSDLTMVECRLDDGQRLLALNEIFVGHQTHQSARYVLSNNTQSERQSSSGVIIATGTGVTGWARSISRERQSQLNLPSNVDRRLAYFVREAWPSVSTGTRLTEGILSEGEQLHITSEMEHGGVVFGDGIETDRILVGWGQEVTVSLAPEKLRLVVE